MTDITEDLISELRPEDEIRLENNVAIKYYNSIDQAFPKNKILFSAGYLTSIKTLKNKHEKGAIKKAITIIDKVFLFLEDLAYS
jgi:Xaa-Pro aminopeptidase